MKKVTIKNLATGNSYWSRHNEVSESSLSLISHAVNKHFGRGSKLVMANKGVANILDKKGKLKMTCTLLIEDIAPSHETKRARKKALTI